MSTLLPALVYVLSIVPPALLAYVLIEAFLRRVQLKQASWTLVAVALIATLAAWAAPVRNGLRESVWGGLSDQAFTMVAALLAILAYLVAYGSVARFRLWLAALTGGPAPSPAQDA